MPLPYWPRRTGVVPEEADAWSRRRALRRSILVCQFPPCFAIYTNKSNCFFGYTVFYTDMPQRSPIFHRQPQYATNIISDMHIEISPSEEAYREEIDMCSRCDIFVLTLIAHISFYLTDTLAYCVNISTYCVYRLSSVPFRAYRFSDLGAYHITSFIRITQILEIYCSIHIGLAPRFSSESNSASILQDSACQLKISHPPAFLAADSCRRGTSSGSSESSRLSPRPGAFAR